MDIVLAIILIIVAAFAGVCAGFWYRRSIAEKKIGRTEEYAKNLLNDAMHKAEEKKKETLLAAKEEVLRLRTELDKEIKERRAEVSRQERRVTQREETLDKKMDNLDAREEGLNRKEEAVTQKQEEAQKVRDEADSYLGKQVAETERIAGMTQDEAKQELIARIQKDAFRDAAAMVRDIESQAKDEATSSR